MAIDLVLSTETGSSLTDNQLDSNFTAIQTAVNSLTPLTEPAFYTQLVLREQKGSALTNEELDSNFIYLDQRVNGLLGQVTVIEDEVIPALEEDIADSLEGKQNLNAKLTSISQLNFNGILSLSGNAVTPRTIESGTIHLTVTNGDGVSGNPTVNIANTVVTTSGTQTLSGKVISGNNNTISSISLTQSVVGVLPYANGGTNATTADEARTNLQALKSPSGTGIAVKTGADSSAVREITVSGVGLQVTNGNGVAGNPVITSSATSANTPSTPVARDSSGNFTANTITANLVGNVQGNASTVTNGVYSNQSYSNPVWIASLAGSKVTSIPNSSLQNASITINGTAVELGGTVMIDTGTANNTSNQVVKRDGSGNFAAGTITATLNGNASTATSAQTSISAQRLVTARRINNVLFDGTEDITVADNSKLPLAGGSLSGFLTLNANPTNALHAATKQYVDTLLDSITQPRAWVKFNGSTGAIIKARNVLSVTIIGAGTYRLNLTPGVFSDGNMIVVGNASDDDHVVTYASSTPTQVVIKTHDAGMNSNNQLQTTSGSVHVMMVA